MTTISHISQLQGGVIEGWYLACPHCGGSEIHWDNSIDLLMCSCGAGWENSKELVKVRRDDGVGRF